MARVPIWYTCWRLGLGNCAGRCLGPRWAGRSPDQLATLSEDQAREPMQSWVQGLCIVLGKGNGVYGMEE